MSPTIESKNGEKEALLEAAKLMLVAARTAPKSGGIDDTLTLIVYSGEKDAIAERLKVLSVMQKTSETQKL